MSGTNADTPAESPPSATSRTTTRSNNGSNSQSSDRSAPTYGYHNTFHTHTTPALEDHPPSYAVAINKKTLSRLEAQAQAEQAALRDALPEYSCSVEIGGVLGLKQELASPFQVAGHREWSDAYVLLRGTQLSIYRLKSPHLLSKKRTPGPGRLVKTYSLQHAEVGVAGDFKKSVLIPRSPFAHLVPVAARAKLFETDPHLFEPIREFVIRLRLETEQFLLCMSTQEEMLTWVEKLCAAIDISPPIEDRSEPRYRSLPRRSRRQRLLEGSRINSNIENLSNLEAGRRIIAEQERIIRALYPHLAGSNTSEHPHDSAEHGHPHAGGDPETDDLDPEDARFPTAASRSGSRDGNAHTEAHDRPSSSATSSSTDPKSTPPYRHSPSQALRYRRRCAPVLLACSPRVSDVVYSGGHRMRILVKNKILVEFTSHPPRYDAHNFSKTEKSRPMLAPKAAPAIAQQERPASPARGISDDSIANSLHESFGYDLSSASSAQNGEEIRFVPSSEPPSPTVPTRSKADAAHRIVTMGKNRTSEEATRDSGLNAVALGVGLIV
ncbi:hypothetical protein CC78DRAFT_12881 [Lojkania enalia]|uniref:PH domain-containing protein n=1 Tax=Lojkania enalia TaxID=147567 RepID=A0A9P4TRN8_9PLEO|nr:hypothetical protein CC78DRAFT_12881 [Didymosphaeria enalia]